MKIRIENFSGIIPKISARLLPDSNATTASSTELYSGELRGLKQPSFIRTVGSGAERAYTANIQKDSTDPYWDSSLTVGEYQTEWVVFTDRFVDFYRGPNINDQYQRHYWTGRDTTPKVVDGRQLIEFGGDLDNCDVYNWGVPNPTAVPPNVLPASFTTGDPVETRAYTYSFVNEWGEESAPIIPSDPETGKADGDWTVTGIQTTYPGGGTWNPLHSVRIYRTVSGFATTDYRLVEEVEIGNLTGVGGDEYIDSKLTSEITLNESLSTLFFDIPPSKTAGDTYNLDGLVELPNGVMCGFVGSDVYFSEPYQPHAWPRKYVVSVGEEIVGLGVYHSGLIVCTKNNPRVISGAHPENMTMVELDQAEPCLSRRSIVSSTDGVFYASQNGVVLCTEYDAKVISKPLISRTEWQTRYRPEHMQAAVNGQGYIAIYSSSDGTLIGPEVGNGAMVDISRLSYVNTLQTNQHDGEVYVIRNGGLYQWNVATAKPMPYIWESKTFETPFPLNFAAFKIKWNTAEELGTGEEAIDSGPYNSKVVNYADTLPENGGLHIFGQFAYGASTLSADGTVRKVYPADMAVDEYYPDTIPMTYGGSDLIMPRNIVLDGGVRVTILARMKNDPEFTTVYSRVITDEEQHHINSTFKADLWRFRFESSNNLYSFVIGEKGSELAQV